MSIIIVILFVAAIAISFGYILLIEKSKDFLEIEISDKEQEEWIREYRKKKKR